jgi:hypothetical protein
MNKFLEQLAVRMAKGELSQEALEAFLVFEEAVRTGKAVEVPIAVPEPVQAAQPAPVASPVAAEVKAFKNGDRVVVPWHNGGTLPGVVIGLDVDVQTKELVPDWYVVLICAGEGDKNRDSFGSFPIREVFLDSERGRINCMNYSAQKWEDQKLEDAQGQAPGGHPVHDGVAEQAEAG